MTASSEPIGSEKRARLVAALDLIRPELHRYCARLTGSTFDGEDIVQDVFERALAAIETLAADAPLRPWIFRIAHNRALDHLRSRAVRKSEPIEAAADMADTQILNAEEALAQKEALSTAVSHFIQLPVTQRSAVILKDVLGHSLAEIAALLDLSVDAVKAALSRGRSRLRQVTVEIAGRPVFNRTPSKEVTTFVNLFQQGNWDRLRALLADDVHLSQTALAERRGRADVGQFFSIYAQLPEIRLRTARLDGGLGPEVIAVYRSDAEREPSYFMQVEGQDNQIVRIRDFRYANYVLDGADLIVS